MYTFKMSKYLIHNINNVLFLLAQKQWGLWLASDDDVHNTERSYHNWHYNSPITQAH